MYFLDELQFIDWEIDSDREDTSEYNESEDGESVVEISDCGSCSSNHSSTSEERPSELVKVSTICLKILVRTFVNHSLLVFHF